ncbi:MAG TPA: HsdR family type I site-specific deoxyribonuclease [Melioribacteraceae bacterium]|nr:HsdR family type I site-specific deoxyribonuclease [Melioribacteraceae bacterium]
MPEYLNIEKPFLKKLYQIGWEPVIDQGEGIPQDPKSSARKTFKDVILADIFKDSIRKINLTDDGKEWLTPNHLDQLLRGFTALTAPSLYEANKQAHYLLLKGTVKENPITCINTPVKFIDFKNPLNNSFVAINQFRLDTPGSTKNHIRPDIVLFVNGLPFVVIECKDFDCSEPLSEAFDQIRRYANLRDDRYGVKEGEERLFHTNLFSIITHGTEARFGSISADFDYYYNWKDIFPEENKKYFDKDINEELELELKPEERQDVLIHGMLNREVVIDILKHFTVFMTTDSGKEVKVVCRYQQYRAVHKIIHRIRTQPTPFDRSGVIWHTQGSGKSLTMVFLIRRMRAYEDLKEYKVILINDRTDLEEQLSKTADLTEEKVTVIEHRADLEKELSPAIPNLNMVMVHKFLEEKIRYSSSLMKAYVEEGVVPEYESFATISESDKIILLIDEAHRTQGGIMSENIFDAFPESTKIAFTGTPLLTDRHKLKTHQRFNSFIDTYKMKDSVDDRATLDILYIGRTSKDQILDKNIFRNEFEDMFKSRTKEEKEEIIRRYGNMIAYLESEKRVIKISEDIIEHYTREILPNGFKAQVVASSIKGAVLYKYEIENALKKKIDAEKAKPDGEKDDELIKQMEFCKVAAYVTQVSNNEEAFITKARNDAAELKAKDNFKKDFNFEKPDTGVAILCVCDRLLTGFDAPIEQVMYLDKNLREHDLLQAVARVNRPKGAFKKNGIVVDYYGVAEHLREALAIYNDDKVDQKSLDDLNAFFRDLNKELPALEARYQRLIKFFIENDVKDIEKFVQQKIDNQYYEFEVAEKCIELAATPKFRAELDVYLRHFFSSLDLLFNVKDADKYWVPAKRFGYLLIRIRNRYKDETMDLKWAGAKVRKLIDKYLVSFGIESKIPPVSLLSEDFPKEVAKFALNPKSKASEMEHAIRKHIKVEMEKDPALFMSLEERLDNIVKNHADDWDRQVLEFEKLRDDLRQGRENDNNYVSKEKAPFFDLMIAITYQTEKPSEEDLKNIARITEIVINHILYALNDHNLWQHDAAIHELEGKVKDELKYFSGIESISKKHDVITAELIKLARNREQELRRIKNA